MSQYKISYEIILMYASMLGGIKREIFEGITIVQADSFFEAEKEFRKDMETKNKDEIAVMVNIKDIKIIKEDEI